jgi:hypothetical protein
MLLFTADFNAGDAEGTVALSLCGVAPDALGTVGMLDADVAAVFVVRAGLLLELLPHRTAVRATTAFTVGRLATFSFPVASLLDVAKDMMSQSDCTS